MYRHDDPQPESPIQSEPMDMADNDNEASAQQRWQELCTGLEEDPATYIREPQDGDVEPPTLAEVLLTMIDWYGLSEWIAEGLSVLERTWPGTVITGTQIHGLLHFPRLIYRWNSVRNYWCFFNERYA